MGRTGTAQLICAAILALTAIQATAEQIVCDFNSNLERSSLHTTIMGVPGQDPVWIAQSLAMQSQWTEQGEGVWAGAASADPDKQVAEIMMSFFEWKGEKALGVSILAAPLTEGQDPVQDGAARPAIPVWAALNVDGEEVVGLTMYPAGLPSGVFPKAQVGYLADPGSEAPFGIDPLALGIVTALVAGSESVSLDIYRDRPASEISAQVSPLARFGFDPEALQADFAWLLDAAPGYLDRFHGGCPDALYGRAG